MGFLFLLGSEIGMDPRISMRFAVNVGPKCYRSMTSVVNIHALGSGADIGSWFFSAICMERACCDRVRKREFDPTAS